MSKFDTPEFTAWKQQRAKRGATAPADDRVYQGYIDLIDGTAGRRRARETVRTEREERQEEHRRHSRLMGYPTPELFRD